MQNDGEKRKKRCEMKVQQKGAAQMRSAIAGGGRVMIDRRNKQARRSGYRKRESKIVTYLRITGSPLFCC